MRAVKMAFACAGSSGAKHTDLAMEDTGSVMWSSFEWESGKGTMAATSPIHLS